MNINLKQAPTTTVPAKPATTIGAIFGATPGMPGMFKSNFDYQLVRGMVAGAYGEGGLRAQHLGALDQLSRVYWFTVEFGLLAEREGLRIYGAGIVSSFAETRFAPLAASASCN